MNLESIYFSKAVEKHRREKDEQHLKTIQNKLSEFKKNEELFKIVKNSILKFLNDPKTELFFFTKEIRLEFIKWRDDFKKLILE